MLPRVLAVIGLLALNAFFVAVEFALVRARRSRLQAMARRGDRLAVIALRTTDPAHGNLTRVLSAGQLGITLASLGLGWVAEEAIGQALEHWFVGLPLPLELGVRVSIAAGVTLTLVTYLHVVLGELAPRAVSLAHPEDFARWLSPPILAFTWLTSPFIWLLHQSAVLLLRPFGVQPTEEEAVHSPEELQILVEQSEEKGELAAQDAELIGGVLEFSEKNAREVMTPRTDVVAVPVEATLEEALAIIEGSGFSRFPVYEESLDHVVGLVLAKDLLPVVRRARPGFDLRAHLREALFVPGSREVEEVLADFKRSKAHLAIVIDEYGGTAGVVTMEDLLEEIVGEILDEHDEAERAPSAAPPGEQVVPGMTHIGELNERLGLAVPDDDYTTIGGWVFGELGRLPVAGDRVVRDDVTFVVQAMDGKRVAELLIRREPSGPPTA